jgi:hypothetical protein
LDSQFGISEKLATKTCLVSEYFSKGRKATPFLYQFFEKKDFHFNALLKKIPKKNSKGLKLKRES